jgi:hypothetical protein
MNIENIKKVINSPATLSFLLLIQIILHLFYFKIQEFDLPNSTKKLVIDTIKNEISFNPKCVNENCKKEVRNLENVLDEISYANQLGRLDTISLLLTLFGIVIGFGAVFGFLHIKESSKIVARDATKEWLASNQGKNEIKEMLESFMKNEAKTEEGANKNRSVEKSEIGHMINNIEG